MGADNRGLAIRSQHASRNARTAHEVQVDACPLAVFERESGKRPVTGFARNVYVKTRLTLEPV